MNRRDQVWEEKRRRFLDKRPAPPPRVVPRTGVPLSMPPEPPAPMSYDHNSLPHSEEVDDSYSQTEGKDPIFEAMVQAEMMKMEREFKDQLKMEDSAPSHTPSKEAPIVSHGQPETERIYPRQGFGKGLSSLYNDFPDAKGDVGSGSGTGSARGFGRGLSSLYNEASPQARGDPQSTNGRSARGFGKGLSSMHDSFSGSQGDQQSQGGGTSLYFDYSPRLAQGKATFGRGLNSLYEQEDSASKRQQQEAYARALAAQMAEKDKEETGSTRRRSARRENKENYVDSPLNYENTGFILPSRDPSSHHLLDKHSPRRRSSLLQGMDFEAEEARRQAQGQAEYARALDAQIAEKHRIMSHTSPGRQPIYDPGRTRTHLFAQSSPAGKLTSPNALSPLPHALFGGRPADDKTQKKIEYAAFLKQQILEKEERKKREKEIERRENAGLLPPRPQTWSPCAEGRVTYATRRGNDQMLPADDLGMSHSRLQHEMELESSFASPYRTTKVQDTMGPTGIAMDSPLYATSPAQPMTEARRRLVRDVYGQSSTIQTKEGGSMGDVKPSFVKHGLLSYDPNMQDTLRLKQHAALEQRQALERQIEEKRRLKAEEDARRRKEEEDDYIRAQVEARKVAEEEEALKLKKEREAELFGKSMKLAAGINVPKHQDVSKKSGDTIQHSPQRGGTMKLPSTSPFPSGRVSSRSLDEEEEAMQRHAYMSSRAPERLPAATRTNWDPLVNHEEDIELPSVRPRQGRRAVKSEGRDGNQRQEEPVRRRRARTHHDNGDEGSMDDHAERLKQESEFIAIPTTERQRGGMQTLFGKGRREGRSPARGPLHSRCDPDEVESFLDVWQKNNGFHRPGEEWQNQDFRNGDKENLRVTSSLVAGEEGSRQYGEQSLASESTFMMMTEKDMHEGDGDVMMSAKDDLFNRRAESPPLSPLAQLLKNHTEIKPDERALGELRKRNGRTSDLERELLSESRLGEKSDGFPEVHSPLTKALKNYDGADGLFNAMETRLPLAGIQGNNSGRRSDLSEDSGQSERRSRWKIPESEDERQRVVRDIVG